MSISLPHFPMLPGVVSVAAAPVPRHYEICERAGWWERPQAVPNDLHLNLLISSGSHRSDAGSQRLTAAGGEREARGAARRGEARRGGVEDLY